MTNESLKDLVLAFNAKAFPSYVSLRRLSDTVTLGYIWSTRPTGRVACESSRKVYFICSGPQCVGLVLEMGFHHSRNPLEAEDLHWYILEEHRGQGHLHRALRDCILPHIFSDERESQRITVDGPTNADYVARQGFTSMGEMTFTMHKDRVDVSRAPVGLNEPLTNDQVNELKARLREARALIISVGERLRCHYGHDALGLNEFAELIEDYHASRLADLDDNGHLPSVA